MSRAVRPAAPPPGRRLPLAALVVAALGAGCVHKVPLVADPVGAYVNIGGKRIGVTPLDLPVHTFGSRRVTVELSGYRTLELRLPFFLPRALEVRLVREHGGAGSWDPEEAE